MFGKRSVSLDKMALAIVLWLCTLPLAAWVIAPIWGLQAAAVAVVALFIATVVICWGICSWKLFDS